MVAPESASSRRRIVAGLREKVAIQLRLEGRTFTDIAEQLGISRSAAHKAVLRALSRNSFETDGLVRNLRALEGERLDALQAVLWSKALGGDLKAVDRLLRIADRRSKLFGLDSPTQFAAADENWQIDLEAEEELRKRILEKLNRLAEVKDAEPGAG